MKRAITVGILVVGISSALILMTWFAMQQSDLPKDFSVAHIGNQNVMLLVARTDDERARGLGGRDSLDSLQGMVFIFDRDDYHAIWMKDMRFPIDILWLSEEGEVVDVAKYVSPETYPTIFSPVVPSRYVLELPAGFVEAYSVHKGGRVQLR